MSWLEAHAISPSLAAAVGVTGERGGEIRFPYGNPFVRTRGRDGVTRQPAGRRMTLYTPVSNRASYVLLCEGEGDTLAAASVLCDENAEPREDLPEPLQGLCPVGIPGASCPSRVICGELLAAGAHQVFVCMDGDHPGRAASTRIVRALPSVGIDALEVHLPDGTDLVDNLVAAENPTDYLATLLADTEAAEGEMGVAA